MRCMPSRATPPALQAQKDQLASKAFLERSVRWALPAHKAHRALMARQGLRANKAHKG